MDQLTIFDELKRQGLEQVNANSGEWLTYVTTVIRYVARLRGLFTVDDVRERCEEIGLWPPHHPNAWGGAMHAAHKDGVCEKTGQYVKSRGSKRNSGMVAVWRSTLTTPTKGA